MPVYNVLTPRNEIQRLHEEVERFLGCGSERREVGRAAAHGVYLGQDDNNLYVEALTAGLDPETMKVTFEDQVLTVKGARPATQEDEEQVRWIRKERQRGELAFQLRIPKPVDTEAISADYRNGILLITLPKASAAKARTIAVNAS